MIKEFDIKNFGPITHAQAKGLGNINLIIGENSSGKTSLLKALYSAIKCHEEAQRGNHNADFSELLSEKLYRTFQVDRIGDLVRKGEGNKLEFKITFAERQLTYQFGRDTQKKIITCHNNLHKRIANSVFLPPKEVLSLFRVIHRSAIEEKEFGFDATYSDLVMALLRVKQKGKNVGNFAQSRKELEQMFDGKVEFDSDNLTWFYRKGNSKYSIMVTAEGIKKIAMLDTLLGNRFLSKESIIFIDEPESALHPTAISKLLDIVTLLAESGIQFFLASHSYFVVKKLLLIAKEKSLPIPVFLTSESGSWEQGCLLTDGLPKNGIIDESINLFKRSFLNEE